MQRNYIILTILLLTLFLCLTQSCKHNMLPDCELPDAKLTYNANMKTIIDRDCAKSGCHSPGGMAVGNYTTYNGIKSHLDNNDFAIQVVVTRVMPQDHKLSEATIDSINCWLQTGYPEN